MNQDEKKELLKIWWYSIVFIVITSVVIFVLNALGVIGNTMVERAVFENSYQKKAGDAEAINIYRAQLAEIERQLANPNLGETTRANLEAKQASIRVLIAGKQ